MYLNVAGTFYDLCSVLDGASCAIVHAEVREAMTEAEVELILQRAREKYPEARPRVISDNGPQFVARNFREFIRVAGASGAQARRGAREGVGGVVASRGA